MSKDDLAGCSGWMGGGVEDGAGAGVGESGVVGESWVADGVALP